MQHLAALLLALTLGHAATAGQSAPAVPTNSQPTSGPAIVRDTVRIATYNVENWRTHFESFRNKGQRLAEEAAREARDQERFQNDEDNWEIAQVFLDPDFAPDIVVIQEGPAEAELAEFNKRWLAGAYETILVFPSNDERGQTIGIMLKPRFKVIERQDQYHKTYPDPDDLNPRSDFLFARGPAFVLVESPDGARFWVGTNHQKSKGGGNDAAITRWRNAEAAATQKIMKELSARGPARVVFLGDMNDELGIQSYELEGGGDVIGTLVGPPADGFVLVTRELAESGQASFMGYWNDTYRSFIDHALVTPALAGAVTGAGVYDSPWARVASDHLPVYLDLKLPPDFN